jgi:hypothetical protein
MSRQGGLRIERMCQLAQVSRAGFHRSLQEAQAVKEAMMVRAEIQQMAWSCHENTVSPMSCFGAQTLS